MVVENGLRFHVDLATVYALFPSLKKVEQFKGLRYLFLYYFMKYIYHSLGYT